MAGKDKVQKYMRLYAGGYDLSGDARSFGSLDNAYQDIDMTGWSNEMMYAHPDGFRATGIRGFQAMMNDAAAGAQTILDDLGQSIDVVLAFGGGAVPAYADPAYLLAGVQVGEQHALDGGRAVLNADFIPDQGDYESGVDNPYGIVAYPNTQISATTNGTAVDNGASSAVGAWAVLHVLEASATTWTIKVQDSANNADWADLITFTADGSAITSEVGVVSGTVDQYLRAQFTRAVGAGDGTFFVAVARNYTIGQAV